VDRQSEAVADLGVKKRPFREISYERFEESDERLQHDRGLLGFPLQPKCCIFKLYTR
jgi:hypothetical protein